MDRFVDVLATETETDISTKYFDLNPHNRVRGYSNKLEKQYLRLTSEANPAHVRPLQVLRASLRHVLSKYISNPDDYEYVCEQFKSIRQDLTVQGINSRFAAHVYECHARIALECGDLGEFNQCQSRILGFQTHNCLLRAREGAKLLRPTDFRVPTTAATTAKPASSGKLKAQHRSKGLSRVDRGSIFQQGQVQTHPPKSTYITTLTSSSSSSSGVATSGEQESIVPVSLDEFTGYSAIYSLIHGNKLEIVSALRSIDWTELGYTFGQGRARLTDFALRILQAARQGNHCRLMKLYRRAPLNSGFLLDYMVATLRRKLLLSLLRGCAPSIPLASLTAQLGFRSNSDCHRYVCEELGCVLVAAGSATSTTNPGKRSFQDLSTSTSTAINTQLKSARTSTPARVSTPVGPNTKPAIFDLATAEIVCKVSYDRLAISDARK